MVPPPAERAPNTIVLIHGFRVRHAAGSTGSSTTRPRATPSWRPRTRALRSRSPRTPSARRRSLELHERYHIPASGKIFWGSALANIHPGRVDTYVDYQLTASSRSWAARAGRREANSPSRRAPLRIEGLRRSAKMMRRLAQRRTD
jgi:hypothetical protein